MQFFHVAPTTWTPGEDLVCWNVLEARGWVDASDWKWPEAPVGFDGRLVCLYETRREAECHVAEHGGQLLVVTIDAEDADLIVRVDEGFPAIQHCIPAAWVERA